ncbi:MAG: porin family protein [Methylovirgula sp.]|nr:porin family protein [Methylovirgula sp.]
MSDCTARAPGICVVRKLRPVSVLSQTQAEDRDQITPGAEFLGGTMRFLAIAALLCSSTAALAADLPNVKAPPVYAPPPFTWSGFYIGANGGYGWTQGSSGTVFITPPGSSSIPYAGNSVNSNGAIAGGQLGYNWQFGSLVLGGEGDFDWTGIKGSTVPDPQNGPVASLLTARQNWLATVRGRVGYAIGQVLLYATGGVGFTEANITDTRLIHSNDTLRSGSATQVGGVVGAGAEWAFAEHWSVKLEYLHAWFGDQTYHLNTSTGPYAAFDVSTSIHSNSDLVRAGINYRF